MDMHGETSGILIVGADHDGLACAVYLAARGLKVKIVKKRAVAHDTCRRKTSTQALGIPPAAPANPLNPNVTTGTNPSAHGLTAVNAALRGA